MCTRGSVPSSWVYTAANDDIVRPLDTGKKAVSVCCYKGHVFLNIRQYFGESYLKFPTKTGITLTRQEFEHLVTLQRDILADFDRHEFSSSFHTTAVDYSPDTCDSNKENLLTIPPIDPQSDDNAVYYHQTHGNRLSQKPWELRYE